MYQFSKETLIDRINHAKYANAAIYKVALSICNQETFVCGGLWRSVFDGTFPKDIDVYFKTDRAKALLDKFLLSTDWSRTQEFPDVWEYRKGQVKIQSIFFQKYSSVENALDEFDFDACRIGFDGQHLYMDKATIQALKYKKITIHSVQHPTTVIKRVAKYASYGYKISDSNAILLAEAIKKDFTGNIKDMPLPKKPEDFNLALMSGYSKAIKPVKPAPSSVQSQIDNTGQELANLMQELSDPIF